MNTSLYSLLPVTMETQHAKEAAELLSEVVFPDMGTKNSLLTVSDSCVVLTIQPLCKAMVRKTLEVTVSATVTI